MAALEDRAGVVGLAERAEDASLVHAGGGDERVQAAVARLQVLDDVVLQGLGLAVLADGDQGLGEVVLDGDGVLAVGGDGAEGREGGAILGDGVALAAVEVGDEGEVVAHGADLGRRRVPAALVDGEGAAVVVGGAGGVLAGVGEGGVALLGVGVVEVVDRQDAADRGGLVGEVAGLARAVLAAGEDGEVAEDDGVVGVVVAVVAASELEGRGGRGRGPRGGRCGPGRGR
jgi:hypothetical protein